MHTRHFSPRIALLITLGCGVLGGSAGYLLGSQGDTIFSIDMRIVGVVLGAVIGSLVPRAPVLGTFAPVAAAGFGVAAPTFTLWVSGRAAPEVIGGMILTASVGSGWISAVITRMAGD